MAFYHALNKEEGSSWRNYYYPLKSYFSKGYGKFRNKFNLIKPRKKVRKEIMILSKDE